MKGVRGSLKKGLVSIVVPSYGRPEKLQNCIDSIFRSDYQNIEVIVVDDPFNGSYACDSIMSDRATLIKNSNEMFVAGSRNVGINYSSGEFIFFIDSDNVVDKKSVGIMVEIMKQNLDIGLIAPVAYYASDRNKIWKCGEHKSKVFRLNVPYSIEKLDSRIFDIESMANAFLIRRNVIDKVGLFDQVNFPRDENEPDYYIRIRNIGFRTVMSLDAITYHDIEIGRFTHFDPERVKESFKSRIWLDKKHKYQSLNFIAFYLILSLPYYLILTLTNSKYQDNLISLFKKILFGLFEGLYRSPKY